MPADARLSIAFAVAALAVGPASLSARPADWPSTADANVIRDHASVQITRTMTLDLPGAADVAFPLFGPVRESEWSPDWAPVFVTPQPGAQTPDGAVFTTGSDEHLDTWVMTDFDPARRIVRYVHLKPTKYVAQLWIEVAPLSDRASRAQVTYRLTRLTPDGQAAINHFTESFPNMKAHWEQHIGAALTGTQPGHPGH
jgi:hypothetical protein